MAVKPRNHGDGDDLAEIADINVTPFIDVTLVLLIIFMVAAPLSTVDVRGQSASLQRGPTAPTPARSDLPHGRT